MVVRSHRWGRLALVALVLLSACASPPPEPAPSGQLRVSVRAFRVSGQELGAEYLGRAFADAVALRLAQAGGLQVLGPGEEGATHLITGELAREGGTARAAVRVLDSEGTELWSGEAVSESGDVSWLASRLATQAAGELGLVFPELYDYILYLRGGPSLADSPRISRALELIRRYDLEALYLLTAELLAEHGEDPTVHVIDAFARAIDWDADPRSEALVELRERLVSLDAADPRSPYDELLRAFVYRASGEPLEAIKLYSQVIERDDLTNANRAWALRQRSFARLQVGRNDSARRDAEESSRLDPVSALSLDALSKAQEAMGLLAEAIESAERALMLEPGGWRHQQRLGITLGRAERLVEAAERIAQSCELSGAQEACANLAVVLQRSGRDAEALEAGRHAETLPDTRWGYYNLACYRALAGEKGRALEALRRAVNLGFADALITTDNDLDPLRDDPAFDALLEEIDDRIRIRREQAREVFPWQ